MWTLEDVVKVNKDLGFSGELVNDSLKWTVEVAKDTSSYTDPVYPFCHIIATVNNDRPFKDGNTMTAFALMQAVPLFFLKSLDVTSDTLIKTIVWMHSEEAGTLWIADWIKSHSV